MKTKILLFLTLSFFSIQMMASHPITDVVDGVVLDVETKIYPNPSNGVFQVNIQSDIPTTYEVKVVNLIGKTIVQKQVETNFETRFDLSSHPKGVYFLQIKSGKKQITKRVVVQ